MQILTPRIWSWWWRWGWRHLGHRLSGFRPEIPARSRPWRHPPRRRSHLEQSLRTLSQPRDSNRINLMDTEAFSTLILSLTAHLNRSFYHFHITQCLFSFLLFEQSCQFCHRAEFFGTLSCHLKLSCACHVLCRRVQDDSVGVSGLRTGDCSSAPLQ